MAPIPRLSPWLVVMQGAMVLREHWGELTAEEQARVRQILSRTRGRVDRLEQQEREELRRIIKRLRPLTVGRKVVMGSRRKGGPKRPG